MVYIDNMNATFGRMIMNHLFADTVEELFQMVDKIGVNRKWFQRKPDFPHFDIALSKKKLAIENGAIEIKYGKELVILSKKIEHLKECRCIICRNKNDESN